MPSPPQGSRITTGDIAALFVAVATLIGLLVPTVTFEWRVASAITSVVLVVALCLTSDRLEHYLPSPGRRLMASIIAPLVIVAILWNPLRRQYAQEHQPPSFPYIFGAPLGDNESPVWIMFVRHYGPSPAYNCKIEFRDRDRENVKNDWMVGHPPLTQAPLSLVGPDKNISKPIPEVDPTPGFSLGDFRWVPLDPDHQHYDVDVDCRDTGVTETLDISRINGTLRVRIVIEHSQAWMTKNPELDRSAFTCTDEEFSQAPLSKLSTTNLAKATNPHPEITGDWQPNHRYTFPAVILPNSGHYYSVTVENPGCWASISTHLGDVGLPLSLPRANPEVTIALIVYEIVMLLPLYCLFAYWVMRRS